jgi:hypothetical protein
MKTLSLSLYNREEYTKKTLDSLNECLDIDNYKIFIFCEPSDTNVVKIAESFRPQQTIVKVNENRLGCNRNIYQSLTVGFYFNDFHIHLEDDTVPAKDFLLYCEYCRHAFKNDVAIYSVCGYNKEMETVSKVSGQNLDPNSALKKVNWFTPWGWATWIDRWNNRIKKSIEQSLEHNASWDTFVHKELRNDYEIVPVIARSQNIGAENGTYCPGAAWHKENQFNEFWIESNQEYRKDFFIYE